MQSLWNMNSYEISAVICLTKDVKNASEIDDYLQAIRIIRFSSLHNLVSFSSPRYDLTPFPPSDSVQLSTESLNAWKIFCS